MADYSRKDLQKFYDEGKIVYGNDPRLKAQFLSTGIKELDELMNGGLRVKASSLFVGMEGQGKTWTAQKTAKKTIENGKSVAYVDIEKAFMPEWWREVGVDITKLVVAQPRHAEEALDMIMGLLEDYDLVIIDSTAGLVPKDEEGHTAEYNPIGLQARFLNKFYRDITVKNTRSTVFVINQLREKVGITYGSPTYIPGGRAQNFFVSSIVQCRRDTWIEDENKKRIGWNLKYEIAGKHRGASSTGDSVIVPVLFSGQIDEIRSNIDLAINLGVIKSLGSGVYEIVDRSTGEIISKIRGKAALQEKLTEDQELFGKVMELVKDAN